LGQLDLQLGFVGAGVAGEDVEDQLAAVDDDPLRFLLQVPPLGRREVVVEDDEFGPREVEQLVEVFEFPLAEARGGMRF
jgi:hypothetical protein